MKYRGHGPWVKNQGLRPASHFLRLASYLFLFILLLASCTHRTEKIPGFLYLRLSSDITTLDPAMIVDVAGGAVSAKIFNGLVRFDEDSKIIPDLAESLSISKDGKVYTFKLRQGVRFHNGREFMDGTEAHVHGIKALDEYTVEIEIKEPFGPFLSLLAMPPAYIVPQEEVEVEVKVEGKEGRKDFSSHPIGTGPFKIKEWKRGRELILSANEDYFLGRPKMGGIAYRIIPEELTAIAEFESGNLDVMGVPSTEFRRYSESPKWRGLIQKSHGLNTFYLGLNCQKPPFNDKRVRQALNYAIDRERILKTILEGRGELASGPIPPFLKPSTLALREREGVRVGYRYDPDKARSILREAGLENGFEFRIYQAPDQDTVDIMEVVQQYLKDVGIRAEIVQLEWSAFKEAINNGEADSFWLSWRADYPDPENFLFPLFHSSNWGSAGNRARFKDPDIDRFIEDAQKEPDEKKRLYYYSEAERRVVEEAPWVFFWHKNDYIIHQPWVKGIKSYPIYNADKGTDAEFIMKATQG